MKQSSFLAEQIKATHSNPKYASTTLHDAARCVGGVAYVEADSLLAR
jgi:hypothetical protein